MNTAITLGFIVILGGFVMMFLETRFLRSRLESNEKFLKDLMASDKKLVLELLENETKLARRVENRLISEAHALKQNINIIEHNVNNIDQNVNDLENRCADLVDQVNDQFNKTNDYIKANFDEIYSAHNRLVNKLNDQLVPQLGDRIAELHEYLDVELQEPTETKPILVKRQNTKKSKK